MSMFAEIVLAQKLEEMTRRAEAAEAALAAYEQQQWMARAIGAESAEERMLAERDKPCQWRKVNGAYYTDCKALYSLRAADWCEFCPGCGHRIEVAILSPVVYP